MAQQIVTVKIRLRPAASELQELIDASAESHELTDDERQRVNELLALAQEKCELCAMDDQLNLVTYGTKMCARHVREYLHL